MVTTATTPPITDEQVAARAARAANAAAAGIDTTYLLDGHRLRDCTADAEAHALLEETTLDLFQRHIGTLEGVDTISLYVLAHLGAAEALDLTKPADLQAYIRKLIGLDVLPEQTDPGAVGVDSDGDIMSPRMITHALIRLTSEARERLRKRRRGKDARAPADDERGDESDGGGTLDRYHSTIMGALRDVTAEKEGKRAPVLTQPEVNKVRSDFEATHEWAPLETDHGDGKAIGQARFWAVQNKVYPGDRQMPYLEVKSAAGGEAVGKGKASFDDTGRLTIDDVEDGEAILPTNSTMHVELFTRKLMTLLLELHNQPVRAGQTFKTISVLREASKSKQLTYGDVNAICSSLRYYQQRVAKEKMAVVLEAYERKVTTLVKGASMYTFGAALLQAWECGIETMLETFIANADAAAKTKGGGTPAGATVPAPGGAGTTPTTGKKRTAEAIANENESLRRQVINLKAGRGRGGRGNQSGRWQQQGSYHPGGQQQNYNQYQGGGGQRGGGQLVKQGGGGNPGGGQPSGGTGGQPQGKPSDYPRMPGGNPNSPFKCKDHERGACEPIRKACHMNHNMP